MQRAPSCGPLSRTARARLPERTIPMGQSSIPASSVVARRVLLLMPDRTAGRSYVRALQRETIAVEWVRTVADLDALTKSSAGQIPALVLVVPSPHERFDARAFADLATRLSARLSSQGMTAGHDAGGSPPEWRRHLDQAFRAYCAYRSLSPRQERVLALYLSGSNDKEMADAFGCSEATVYEHWRRMAKKASGFHKWDAVTDFHRFLAGAGGNDVMPVEPKADASKSVRVDTASLASRRNG